MANLEVKDFSTSLKSNEDFWCSENFIIILLFLIAFSLNQNETVKLEDCHNSGRGTEFSEHQPLPHPRLTSLR